MIIVNLTPAEEDIMNCLWTLRSAYFKDIMEHLDAPKPHQNTVSTYLKILVEKQFLKTKKEGRIFKYEVTVPFEDYQNFKLKNLVKYYFHQDGKALLERLIELGTIKSDDFQQFFEVQTSVTPKKKKAKKSDLREFVEELTKKKKAKKKKKK